MFRSCSSCVLVLAFGLTGCAGAPADAPRERADERGPVSAATAPAATKTQPAAAPGVAAKPAPRPVDPQTNAIMESYAKESRMRREERHAISEHYFRVGKAFYDELDYTQARKNFELAVKADSENRIAERHLQATQSLLGEREATVREVADALAEKQVAGRDQKRIELRRIFDEGMRFMDAGDYDKSTLR